MEKRSRQKLKVVIVACPKTRCKDTNRRGTREKDNTHGERN